MIYLKNLKNMVTLFRWMALT
uniref:Uncharacterized protein n=1 Tax=Arundo donax TaxID=35708 RepID=A0A0A9DHA3_ARUDO